MSLVFQEVQCAQFANKDIACQERPGRMRELSTSTSTLQVVSAAVVQGSEHGKRSKSCLKSLWRKSMEECIG